METVLQGQFEATGLKELNPTLAPLTPKIGQPDSILPQLGRIIETFAQVLGGKSPTLECRKPTPMDRLRKFPWL